MIWTVIAVAAALGPLFYLALLLVVASMPSGRDQPAMPLFLAGTAGIAAAILSPVDPGLALAAFAAAALLSAVAIVQFAWNAFDEYREARAADRAGRRRHEMPTLGIGELVQATVILVGAPSVGMAVSAAQLAPN